jgi:hypothetical protein
VKHFAIITILAAVLASGQADAALVASKAECLSACAPQIAGACGGLRRAKYNRCLLALVRQCRRFGPETVCPDPPATPTTTTTLPPLTTSTPTTLPSIPDLRGHYTFQGTVTSDPCGAMGIWNGYGFPFTVSTQSGISLSGMLDTLAVAASGTITSDGSWTFIGARQCDPQNGCCFVMGVTVSGVHMPAVATAESMGECPLSAACTVQIDGTVSPAP